MIERENFAKMIQGFKQDDLDQRKELQEKHHKYKNDLLQQIAFNNYQGDLRKLEDQMERESMQQEEQLFQSRIQATLNEDWVDPRAHPYRRGDHQFWFVLARLYEDERLVWWENTLLKYIWWYLLH